MRNQSLNQFFLSITLSLVVSIAIGQSDTYKLDIGLNLVNLLNEAVTKAEPIDIAEEDYTLDIGFLTKKNQMVRLGIAFDFGKQQQESLFFPGEFDQFDRQNISIKLGYKWNQPIYQKWLLAYGMDLVYSYFDETRDGLNVNRVNQITTSAFRKYGGGPFLGIRFAISDRISIWTEASIRYTYITRIIESDIPDWQISRKEEFYNHSTKLLAPTNLYLSFRI